MSSSINPEPRNTEPPDSPSTQPPGPGARSEAATGNRRLLSVNEVMGLTGLGRTRIYAELRHDLKSVRVGSRRMIRAEALEAWLERLPSDR